MKTEVTAQDLQDLLDRAIKELEGAGEMLRLAGAHCKGAEAATKLLLDLIERLRQGEDPTQEQVINWLALKAMRETKEPVPRLNAKGEIEYPEEALDQAFAKLGFIKDGPPPVTLLA